MEITINDIIREHDENGDQSQWTPEDSAEMVTVCETCHSENVHTAGDGGMGFCEDCDAPCSTITVTR
jgi:hypothetical protein